MHVQALVTIDATQAFRAAASAAGRAPFPLPSLATSHLLPFTWYSPRCLKSAAAGSMPVTLTSMQVRHRPHAPHGQSIAN